ncbi:MAG: hypothetical protein L3J75_14815 [Methylococcaceae bacterium]|nr:hypothetical protein [Methylococcaceae bacterium]
MKIFMYIILATISLTAGVNAMSFFNNDTELNWEWPANRVIKYKIIIDVSNVAAEKKWLKSPSLAADLPEPTIMQGKVLLGDLASKIERIRLILPKVELGGVTKGSKIALGMIDSETVVCITEVPANTLDSELAAWLMNWECNKTTDDKK